MGRVTFTETNKSNNDFESFPKLKLDKGERARIVCLEDPVVEYVHNLRAPKILNGAPVMIKQKKFQSEEMYETYDMDFIGNPRCIGDPGILADKGSDPDNCPACAAAKASDTIRPPQRRFAMHVIKYSVKPNSSDVSDPYGVATVVWAFTDMVFNKLVDYAAEYDGGLPRHDLILGPCTDKNFQKFDIMASQKAEWLAEGPQGARAKLTAATFKGTQTDDLEAFCGQKKSKEWIEEALLKIKARWNIINGIAPGAGVAGVDPTVAFDSASLAQGLDDLLGGSSTPAPAAEATPAAEPAAAAPAASSDLLETEIASAPKPNSGEEIVNFDDLIGSLGS